jgi:hypothetical protein
LRLLWKTKTPPRFQNCSGFEIEQKMLMGSNGPEIMKDCADEDQEHTTALLYTALAL